MGLAFALDRIADGVRGRQRVAVFIDRTLHSRGRLARVGGELGDGVGRTHRDAVDEGRLATAEGDLLRLAVLDAERHRGVRGVGVDQVVLAIHVHAGVL